MSVTTRIKSAGQNNARLRNVDCLEGSANVMDDDERSSMDWIRRTVDYRTLTGKRDQLGYPLGALEAARLAELERFFAASQDPDLEVWAQREQERAPISIVVTFSSTTPGRGRGRARDISGDGVFVDTAKPLRIGERTVVS